MNYYYITGTSRGIGKALAEALLEDPQNHVTGISRTASIVHERYEHVPIDLSDIEKVKAWKFPVLLNTDKIVLVNNAGMIGGVRHAGRVDADELVRACNVNLVAPLLLTNAFLQTYAGNPAQQIVLNISSGAAARPVDGWSVYCATKAGLEHFARTVDSEVKLDGKENVFILSVAPGVVDTAMQSEIRSSNAGDFSRLQEFIGFKKSDQLADPGLIARKYLSILGSPKKYGETVFSVKDIPPAE